MSETKDEKTNWRIGDEMLTPAGTVCIEDPASGDVGYVFPEYVEQIIADHAQATAIDEAREALQSIEDLLGDALVYLRPPAGDEALETALPWVEAADKEATKALAALTPAKTGEQP